MDTQPTEQKGHKQSNLLAILLGLAVLVIVGLIWWCFWGPGHHTTTPVATASGPCKDGAANTLPAGFSWYENADLGYKFAYPTAWGAVTVATTPMGGTSGHYAQGSFASNPDVAFGGNATDYVVSAREGISTDNPGFLEANGKFYEVQLWKLHDVGGVDAPSYNIFEINEAAVAKDTCNTKAVISQLPFIEFFGYSYDVARINLQPTNLYYGVNFVLKNPSAASRADLDKVITSFQLIP